MTKKDYEAIAHVFNARMMITDRLPGLTERIMAKATTTGLARDVAVVMADDNPNFDRHRFLRACGVEE